MVGTPGYPWSPYSTPSTHEGEAQRSQLEAALVILREQRGQIAAEIGEYLYGLVIAGQMRDPVVLAACRRLYDHEQEMQRLEANLRALPPASVNQTPGYTPSVPARAPGMPGTNPPTPPSNDPAHLDAETLIAPIPRSNPPSPTRGKAADRQCTHCHMPVRATDTICPVCGKPVNEPAAAHSSQCNRCGTELRPQDKVCPVCGTART